MFGYKQAALFDELSSNKREYEYRYNGEIVKIDNTDYEILYLISK